MAESEEELKSLLMNAKEERKEAGLKFYVPYIGRHILIHWATSPEDIFLSTQFYGMIVLNLGLTI